jgi:type IV secretion system protein VirD4
MDTEKVKSYLPFAILSFSIFYFANRISYIFRHTLGENILVQAVNTLENLQYIFGHLSVHMTDLLFGSMILLLIFLILELKSSNRKTYRKGIEYGSASWGTAKDIKAFLPKNEQNKILLSQSEALMINEKPKDLKYQRNLNVLVIGGTGSGKTRFVLKPNLMQLNSSYVVTDSKGNLIKETGQMFADKGYKIKVLNLVNMKESMHYNPMKYINNESDILKFVDYLISNTTNPNMKGGDEFWVNAERLLYMALIGYMFEVGDPEERNFETLIELLNNMQVDENNQAYKNPVDFLFDDLKETNPQSFALSQYTKYKMAAGKTAKSILISAGTRLSVFDIQEVKELTRYDELDLEQIGDEKTIFYIVVSDTSTTFNFLAGIMYSQLFNVLIEHADKQKNNALDIPVQMYLDEFANIGTIPNFEKIIASIRSRGISAVPILQSLAQLKSKYKDSSDTIIGNCDTQIFLGGKEGTTLKQLSELLGKQTIDMQTHNLSRGQSMSYSENNQVIGRELMTMDEISVMDNNESIIQIRGVKPFKSKKYKIEKHKNYQLISDTPEDNKAFNVMNYLNKLREEDDDTLDMDHLLSLRFKALNAEGIEEEYVFDPASIQEETPVKMLNTHSKFNQTD